MTTNMQLCFQPVDITRMGAYIALFRLCFPSADHLNETYLTWLYASNPDGQVIGFDAWDRDILVAHYVCIPARAWVEGELCRVLLSLNTATSPAYQGQGLFTRLATLTYEYGANEGFRAVYGVANANSTPGFLRNLGFKLVCPLEAHLGIGRLFVGNFDTAVQNLAFLRVWSPDTIAWRMANPSSAVSALARSDVTSFYARTRNPLITAYAELASSIPIVNSVHKPTPFSVFVGTVPLELHLRRTWWPIPSVLKPSPLNLIYRDLVRSWHVPAPDRAMISFLDFDAF